MTDVPEHLLNRSRERRAALGKQPDGGDAGAAAAGGPTAPAGGDAGDKIPPHLLARSQTAEAGGAPAAATAKLRP